MTKKDYILIADCINRSTSSQKIDIVDNLVRAFEQDNPKFDSIKFYDACGIRPPHDD